MTMPIDLAEIFIWGYIRQLLKPFQPVLDLLLQPEAL
uniref:Uncharacterized protein n=1 Tax=Arundo donax TaxID=35708 RepID=A0A0A9A714_ARUDO